MKFNIKNSGKNSVSIGRDIGYILQKETSGSEVSFVRPLERGGYPRFHLYVKLDGDNLMFDLHLDQKRPVYKTAHDHAAEYDGALIKNEIQRIKQTLI
ncbi:hypothetical protein KKC65_02805 [Patescibacteria group bacterium]|nr:hypothetical protein [Patescibacteria group bacterium]